MNAARRTLMPAVAALIAALNAALDVDASESASVTCE